MAKTNLFIGRCKVCKTTRRIEAPVAQKYEVQLGYGRTEIRVRRVLPDGKTVEGNWRFHVPCNVCPPRNGFGYTRSVEFNLILGRVTDHECNAKCMASTGHVCECSCGGANHGKSFAL
jgi:hypothetical protein